MVSENGNQRERLKVSAQKFRHPETNCCSESLEFPQELRISLSGRRDIAHGRAQVYF